VRRGIGLLVVAGALVACAGAPPSGTGQPSREGRNAKMPWNDVSKLALEKLTDDERRDGVAYLDEREWPVGSTLQIDKQPHPVKTRTAVVFVDRAPRANWGHSCRYLLVDLDARSVESIEAQFPPFLTAVPKTLKVIWKGPNVPDWAVRRP
jgi:hypothetical protein